ncbi:hypothetical protein [Ekhidna sp.]|uniref:hypothetical protein n=1 Tax=Ekhidna sp. TaxID=2608089 RepID=UPI003B596D1F
MKLLHTPTSRVALSILMVYLITSLHHVYGAWLYETPWRNHIAYQGFTWLILSYIILIIYWKWGKVWLKWTFVIVAGFFFVLAIGVYEGLYNHLLKNLLYFAGVGETILQSMYPPPKYELPNDLLFEVTGVLTFIVCLWCFKTMISFLKR